MAASAWLRCMRVAKRECVYCRWISKIDLHTFTLGDVPPRVSGCKVVTYHCLRISLYPCCVDACGFTQAHDSGCGDIFIRHIFISYEMRVLVLRAGIQEGFTGAAGAAGRNGYQMGGQPEVPAQGEGSSAIQPCLSLTVESTRWFLTLSSIVWVCHFHQLPVAVWAVPPGIGQLLSQFLGND